MTAGRRTTRPAAAVGSVWLGTLLGIGVFAVTFGFRYLSYNGFSNDHFVHLSRAQQMLLGQWPVRDFADPGMPLMYAVSAAGLLSFGHNLLGEALIVSGAIAAAGALTFLAARAAAGSTMVGLAAALLEAVAYPRSHSYPKLLLYAVAIVICWRCIAQPTVRRCTALGALVAVAFLFRHDHGMFIGASGAVAVLLARGRFGGRLPGAVALAATTLLLLTPWIVFVHRNAGVSRYLRSAFEFSRAEAAQTWLPWPRFHVDPAAGLWTLDVPALPRAVVDVRWVPTLSPAERAQHERRLGLLMVEPHEGRTWRYTVERSFERAQALSGDSGVEYTAGLEQLQIGWGERLSRLVVSVTGGPGPGLPVGENRDALLYYTMLGLPLVALVVAVGRRGAAAPMPDAGARLVVVALLALCTGATFLRDPLHDRLADAIVPAAVLGAWLAAAAWRVALHLPRLMRLPAGAAVLTCACVVAGSVVLLGNTGEQLARIGPMTRSALIGRAQAVTRSLQYEYATSFPPGPNTIALRPAIAWLQECTELTDRFSYIGFAPEAYFFADRGFAGGHVVFFFGYYSSPAEQLLTLERFRRERVPLILLPERDAAGFERRFPFLAEYVIQNFVSVGTLELSENNMARVLTDRHMTPSRTYLPLGWPCFR